MTTTVAAEPALPAARPPITWRPVLIVIGVAVLVHLAVAARYGWHRDEFYYVIAGRHPAFGYVDQPPLAPLLAAGAAALPGGVLPLRLLAIAAQAGCLLLAPVLAAEFGGRRRAQLLTTGAVAASPVFVAGSSLFGTTVLDQLVWVALLVLITRALRVRRTGAWLAAGLVAGVGLETKDTVAVLLLGVAAGLVWWHRDVLRTKGPWLAAALALVLAAPNLVWDARHGWPDLAMAASLSSEQGGPLGALAEFPLLPLVLAGPPLIGLWLFGVRRLASPAGRQHRWVLVAAAVVVVLVVASGGKEYYPAPLLVPLFAAGAVRVEIRLRERGTTLVKSGWPTRAGFSFLIAVLIGLPVLPPSTLNVTSYVNSTAAETYGWPGFVDQVGRAAATLPPGTPIFTSNYGEAGALTILGRLPNPVISAHVNYTYWGPPPGRPSTVLCVGEFDQAYLHRFFASVTEIAPITMGGARTEETEQHAALYRCADPRGSWAAMWPALTHFD